MPAELEITVNAASFLKDMKRVRKQIELATKEARKLEAALKRCVHQNKNLKCR